jgi:hypothetical protein
VIVSHPPRRCGPYTIDRDCTSTASYPDPTEYFELCVAPDGSMCIFIQTEIVLSAFALRRTGKRIGD